MVPLLTFKLILGKKFMKDNIDFIVIGSGASGAAFSWKMSMAGAKVVCIEQAIMLNQIHIQKKGRI